MGTSLQNAILSWLGKSPFIVCVWKNHQKWMDGRAQQVLHQQEPCELSQWLHIQMLRFILDVCPSQGPIPEHPTTAKRAGFTKQSRLVPSVPYNTFFSVCLCSLTNCPLALGRSSLPYFADRVLSAEIVCSFVLY